MRVSIVIPAYNEERRIGKTLEEYVRFFKYLKKDKILDFEIIIVINNTRDRTEEIVLSSCKKNQEVRCLNFREGGKGFAIVEGFKDALKRDNDLIGFVDADMATPPEAFYDLVRSVNKYDGIIASRWLKKSIVKTRQSFLRRVLSRGFNFLVRALFSMPYIDTQCGAKLFTKKTVEKIIGEIGITKWAFDVNLLYICRKKHLKIMEIPTIWEDKKDSKLDVTKVPIQMFSGIIRLRLINSPFNFVVRAYDKVPEIIKLHHKL